MIEAFAEILPAQVSMRCWNFPNAMRHATCYGPNLSDKGWESTFESTRELHFAILSNFGPATTGSTLRVGACCPTDILFQHVSFLGQVSSICWRVPERSAVPLGRGNLASKNWRHSTLADRYGWIRPNKVVYLDYAGAALFSRAQLAATQARFRWDWNCYI